MVKILFFFLIFFSQTLSFAKNFSGALEIGATSNRYDWDSQQNEATLDTSLSTIYRPNKDIFLGHAIGAYRPLQSEESWELSDGYFFGSQKLTRLWNEIESSLLLRVFYPSSEQSREEQSMQTKIFLAPVFTANLESLGAPFIDLSYRPGYAHGFYQYTTSSSGESNIRSTLSQMLSLGLTVSELVQLSSTFNYSWSWAYSGQKRPDQFSWAQEVLFTFSPILELRLAYQNQDQAQNPLGTESNIHPLDDQTGAFALIFSVNF